MHQKSVLADFGFMSKGEFSDQVEQSIARAANNIATTIGIEPNEVGAGIRLGLGERIHLALDDEMNMVDLSVTKEFSESLFSYGWALALHVFHIFDNSKEAINALMHNEITVTEASKRITMRWKNTELAIQNTLESIFANADDPELGASAIKAFHGQVDGLMTSSTEHAIIAIKRLHQDATELGCVVDSEHTNLLSMLLSMRSDCGYDIQKLNALGDEFVKAPIAYYARMTDLAATEDENEIIERAPAIALASVLVRNAQIPMTHADKRCLPTEDEMVEIESRIPFFSSALTNKLVKKSQRTISI